MMQQFQCYSAFDVFSIIEISEVYRVFQKKLHKVCHVINFEPFVVGLQCLH